MSVIDLINKYAKLKGTVNELVQALVDKLMLEPEKGGPTDLLQNAIQASGVSPSDGMPALIYIIGQNLRAADQLTQSQRNLYATALGTLLIEIVSAKEVEVKGEEKVAQGE